MTDSSRILKLPLLSKAFHVLYLHHLCISAGESAAPEYDEDVTNPHPMMLAFKDYTDDHYAAMSKEEREAAGPDPWDEWKTKRNAYLDKQCRSAAAKREKGESNVIFLRSFCIMLGHTYEKTKHGVSIRRAEYLI